MMQDYPRSLPASAKVGFTVLDTWIAFSPVKSNPADAAALAKRGQPPMSAASGELAQYAANCRVLRLAGAVIPDPVKKLFNAVELDVWPIVYFSCTWAPTFSSICAKIEKLELTNNSALVIQGEDITIKSLFLDGALVIRACSGATVVVENCKIKNDGWVFVALDSATNYPEDILLRGFTLEKKSTRELIFDKPGNYVVNEL